MNSFLPTVGHDPFCISLSTGQCWSNPAVSNRQLYGKTIYSRAGTEIHKGDEWSNIE